MGTKALVCLGRLSRSHVGSGGWSNNPSKNWGDTWYSKDGKDWKQLTVSESWKERHEHSTFVFQDKLWVAGGHAQPLSSEVWSLQLPKDSGPAKSLARR